MRAWGIVKRGEQKSADAIVDIGVKKRTELPMDLDFVSDFVGELAHELDIERPVIVKKHLSELLRFGHVTFKKADFIDAIDFDKFTVEIIE